jgi:hypothetical protein
MHESTALIHPVCLPRPALDVSFAEASGFRGFGRMRAFSVGTRIAVHTNAATRF